MLHMIKLLGKVLTWRGAIREQISIYAWRHLAVKGPKSIFHILAFLSEKSSNLESSTHLIGAVCFPLNTTT